jgi:SAM-dependent methyltransferase
MAARQAAPPPVDLCSGGTGPVVTLRGVPVFCNALYPTAEAARAAARGDIELWFSRDTGYLWNRAFDPDLVAYNPAYENSLHHSPRFAAYARQLAERLIARYGIRDGRIVEIGAGEGNFLSLLCELGGNAGVGYDPSHDPARTKVVTSDRVRIIADYFPVGGLRDADLVVCQHVLEHLSDPAGLLRGVRDSVGPRTVVYLEVPDATYMVSELAVWDLIYEHHSYFAAPTLAHLFRASGFELTDVGRSFGDQYLYVEARAAADGSPVAVAAGGTDAAAITKLAELVDEFDEHFTDLVQRWTRRLGELVSSGPTAVWGAGSKGVTFLNLIEPGRQVTAVVDVNPNKVRLHLPGPGQQVVAPEAVAADAVDHVLVMNPLYLNEIAAQLASMGSRAEVIAVSD